jgi:hypothetical protein
MMFLSVMSAILCGCSDEYVNKSDTAVSFTAEISGRTETRATVDTTKNMSGGTNLIVRACEPAKGITESVSAMTRTSTVDGSWSAGNIAVEEGSTVKEYSVDASGNITSSSPFYWTSKSNVSVTSWYPYSASLSTWTVNSDQSTEAKYAAGDLLYASGTLTYGSSNKLTFSHKTAKVVINIVKANGITSSTSMSVTIGSSSSPISLSGSVGSDGTLTAVSPSSSSTTSFITPFTNTSFDATSYAASYSALVIPQNMNGKQFIAIKVGSTTYYYKPTSDLNLQAGRQYIYNVTIPNTNTPATVGTYYFKDGTWGTLADNSGKTPIAVVFSSTPGSLAKINGFTHGLAIALTDANSGSIGTWGSYSTPSGNDTYYTTPLAASGDMDSGFRACYVDGVGASSYSGTYNAYYQCHTAYESKVSANPYNATSNPSGNKNSGWYLPSMGEVTAMFQGLGLVSSYTNLSSSWGTVSSNVTSSTYSSFQNYFTNAGGTAMVINNYYWSSSEYNSSYYACIFFYSSSVVYYNAYDKSGNSNYMRAVLAF